MTSPARTDGLTRAAAKRAQDPRRWTWRAALVGALLSVPLHGHAWWSKDFKQRTRITLNTSAVGVETKEALSAVTIPVRLHSGNFDFLQAKPDGSDLRAIAGDDKTPLKFSIERYDSTNELAIVWVQVPVVAPGTDKNTLYLYAGNEKAASEGTAAVFDAKTSAAFHFAEKDGSAMDHLGSIKATAPVALQYPGQIGQSARVDGTAIEWPANERLRVAAGGPFTVGLWVKPEPAEGPLLSWGPVSIVLQAGRVQARVGATPLAGGELPVGAWAHVALVVAAARATLYVNGVQAAQADLAGSVPAIDGALRVGGGLRAGIDELQVATVARSADWIAFARASQGADARLIASVTQSVDAEEPSGNGGYIAVLVNNLTNDAKVVIAILGAMFAIAAWVMVTKALLISRVERGNRDFLKRFREGTQDLMKKDLRELEGARTLPGSSLFRLYSAGIVELRKRNVETSETPLSGASIDAIKAAVDADMVRETHRLNAQMVLLTIAISGGPFLGLLGTVVGVMITFAAIAAAGDVNVNAIAPGIAAALLATVAGLAVAIPSLFGYNYLASRIKDISSEMQIFVDEFATRVAERYGAR